MWGAVDSTIAVRRGIETAHPAPPVTRKELSNDNSNSQRTHLIAAPHNDRRGRSRCRRYDARGGDHASPGVHLAVHGRIPLAGFAQLTFTGAVLGGMLVAVLNRRSTLPRRRFIQIAMALTALSCLGPAAGGDDAASKIGLIAIHLLAATIIAPILARQTTR